MGRAAHVARAEVFPKPLTLTAPASGLYASDSVKQPGMESSRPVDRPKGHWNKYSSLDFDGFADSAYNRDSYRNRKITEKKIKTL